MLNPSAINRPGPDARVPAMDEAAIRRLTELYAEAPEATRAAGREWYPAAAAQSRAIARGAGISRHRAAGIIAALSPRAQWAVNLAWAAKVAAAATCPAVHTRDARAKAWAIRTGERPLSVLRGPKVRAFYRAIMGDTGSVVLDVWAMRAMGDDRQPRPGADYARCAELYRRAAERCGESPRDFQAIVWLQLRGAKPSDAPQFRPEAQL